VTADRFGPQVPGLVISRLSCFVADCGGAPESVTFSVNADVPAFAGVPVIAPLFAFKLSPAGNVPVKTLHVTGCAPPDSCRVALYAVPSAALASDVVAIVGSGATVTAAEAVFVASATEVAVRVTARLLATAAGALYVSDVIVTFVSVPHAAPVQAVPEMVHMTPLLPESFVTVAVKLTVCPWSMD
jgi:hypothetical protein